MKESESFLIIVRCSDCGNTFDGGLGGMLQHYSIRDLLLLPPMRHDAAHITGL